MRGEVKLASGEVAGSMLFDVSEVQNTELRYTYWARFDDRSTPGALRGRISRATLRSFAGSTLLELGASRGELSPAEFELIIRISESNGLMVQLTTDLPGEETVIVRLFRVGEPVWARRCPLPITS